MKKFFIFSHPRTGSSFFCNGVLSKHSSIKCYGEIFNNTKLTKSVLSDLKIKPYGVGQERRKPQDFLEKLISKTMDNNPNLQAIGFKIFPWHLNKEQIISLFSDWEVMFLRRVPIAQSAISFEIAKKTGQWGLRDKKKIEYEMYIDPMHVLEFCKKNTEDVNMMEQEAIQHQKNYLNVEYGTLYEKTTLKKIEHWLEIFPELDQLDIAIRKLNTPDRYSKIKNLKEIEYETEKAGFGKILDISI